MQIYTIFCKITRFYKDLNYYRINYGKRNIKSIEYKTSSGSGTITIGQSGETITIPSGCTITNSGTQTGFGGVYSIGL